MGDISYLENLRSINDRNLGIYKTVLDLALEDKKILILLCQDHMVQEKAVLLSRIKIMMV
ncbi:hypothetical protein [Latilactobacillus sakei]|uniref:hypothetical protein n=1 Tax=Latilactobacillus sakei TaxID=1599 RepID=UPI000DD2FE9F|nr:hypothetical protein [Latilactobacillus sakei]